MNYLIIYLIGVLIAYSMLTIEYNAENHFEGRETTIGDKVVCIVLAFVSWLMIVIILISAWIGQIKNTGYWNKPIRKSKSKAE